MDYDNACVTSNVNIIRQTGYQSNNIPVDTLILSFISLIFVHPLVW